MSNQSPTASGDGQLPKSGDESEPLGDDRAPWSPEQPVGRKDMTHDEMADIEEGVVSADPDSDALPPPALPPD